MVRFASLFNATERTVTFLSGKRYSLDTLCSLGAGELLLSMCEFSEKLAALRLDSDEMSLFTAVVLVSAGKKEGRERQISVHLQYYLHINNNNKTSLVFRSLRHPGPECCGGSAGPADPGAAEPDW